MALIIRQNIRGYLQVRFRKRIYLTRVSQFVFCQSRIVFFLMNIHNGYRTIYFARVSESFSICWHMTFTSSQKSGESLIEHSYKADSDLSPVGWDYAERLKDFVLERRAKTQEQRGI